MAEIVAGFAGPVVEVVKWAAQPITRQFNYLCCYSSNINSLKREAEELSLATRGLQEQVDRERENVRVIVPEVESWLTKSKEVNDQKDTILDEVPHVKSGCLKLAARISLSKRAKETTYLMKELRDQKNFDAISQPGPPAATHEILLGKTYEFESRKKFEEEIMATLRDGAANVIGICGMGGLGKTTMARRIMNRVLKEHVFEEVAMAVVSQQVDNSNIQVEIGGSLGLKNLKDDTSQVRAQKLHARLTGTKRILLVLDDIWEGLELESLGIPCDSKGCKILLTSRNKDALSEMDVEKFFRMEILSVEEAWFLFRKRVGTYVDDANLNPIAKEVVDECGGLPIALTAVGAALKDEKDECIWKDALRQLRQCDEDILNFIGKVYNPLKLSYDFLRSQQAKSLLLLCSLFPEDAYIWLDRLTYCCMGLGIFEGTINLEGARNKMRALAKMLKSRSVLLDGFEEGDVRMHDVVRDVCTIIAKNEKYIGGNDCAWISSSELIREKSEFRTELGFPNLRFFLMTQNSKSEEEFKFDSVFLKVVRDLHVLWIEKSTLTSLPHATQPLKNLNTLVLDSCYGLKTISVVGEMENLKILICWLCGSLEELPLEIKRTNRLKCLELVSCFRLQSIGRGIISSLVGLERLRMVDSFSKWEAEDTEERENARLGELQALTNLTSLEIEIEDAALVAENMHISKKLERFYIRFDRAHILPEEFHIYDKRMSLCLERETCLGHWIKMQLLRETESLSLRGNGAKDVDLGKSQNIKCLSLSNCETTKNIVTTPCDDVDVTVFPASLKYIELDSLPQLQEISISFQNLSSIIISDCPRLPNLAKLSIAGKDCLSQLEKLRIERCEMMEQVLLWKEGDNNRNNSESRINSHVKFPKLKEVSLDSLPNLATFCQGIEGIEFPLLTEICIEECPKRTSMVSSGILGSKENKLGGGSSSNADIVDDYSSHLFCQSEKVSFGNLEKLEIDKNPFCGHEIPASSSYSGLTYLIIRDYHGSRSLLSSSIATNLFNLRQLIVSKCDEIVQVIKDDDEEPMAIHGGERKTVLFPKLEELYLINSPKLVSFCELKCDVALPSLRVLAIKRCPSMKNLSLGFLAAPNLEEFRTDFNHHLEVGVHASFDRLKTLDIKDVGSIEYPFYHHKFFIHHTLNGLERLELYRYPSMSLFPSSIAEKLVNLHSLRISSCDEMVKVIEEEEEELEAVSGGRRTLLFPKLEELQLSTLPKLVSFCERTCGVELPSLRQVGIYSCPIMKSFNLGPLIAPNLKYIKINFEEIGGEKDLNGVLQQYYSAPAKEEEEEKEKKKKNEGGEEAQESKGEIEEDQN